MLHSFVRMSYSMKQSYNNGVKMKTAKILTKLLAIIMCAMLLFMSAGAFTDIANGTSLGITATGAILIDTDTNTILYRKSVHEECRPASLTKMMTLLVAYEQTMGRQDELVTITANMIDVPSGSSSAELTRGDVISIKDLFYAMMLPSGNDAAKALACVVSGNEDNFVELMNRKAQELNMTNSHFMNAHGFDDDAHYTTTYDLALLACELCKNEELVNIFSKYKYSVTIYSNGDMYNAKTVTYYNTNTMLNPNSSEHLDGLMGIKTGYTSLAGNCLASYYVKDGRHLLAVITHSDQSQRDNDTRALYKYGMNSFSTFDASDVFASKDITVDVQRAVLTDDSNGQLELFLENSDQKAMMTVSKSEWEKIKTFSSDTITVRKPTVTAPINAGDYVGDVEYVYNNEVIYSIKAYASRSIGAEIESPADLVKIESIKGKAKLSLGFLKSKYFIVPLIIVILVGVGVAVFMLLKRRQAMRVRLRQRDISRTRRTTRL